MRRMFAIWDTLPLGLQTFRRYYSRYIDDVFAIQLANCDIGGFHLILSTMVSM